MLGRVWADRRIGGAATVGAAAAYGLFAGWWTPRGPLTSVEALAAIAISLVVGALAGIVMRTRWALLLA
ncbi:MAG: peptidase, partial [Actinomycetota bacterium]|nr:peptidase [Actinomycetota bacterium]